jgi:RNA polymerase sigma-70 factor (ECF subfamily)
MPIVEWDTEQLIERASRGDDGARQDLLARHRDRLRRMVRVYLDRRVAARVDPSDVIQETLVAAAAKLPDYLRDRPLPFYPWLRQIAWERLVKIHRTHLRAGIRSAAREEPGGLGLPDESALDLARQLVAPGTSPSNRLVRDELCDRVRRALDHLSDRDREVLVMRYLEQLPTREIAAALEITEGAVKVRHLRALERIRGLLAGEFGEAES